MHAPHFSDFENLHSTNQHLVMAIFLIGSRVKIKGGLIIIFRSTILQTHMKIKRDIYIEDT